MNHKRSLLNNLKNIITLLKEEKKALINNDLDKITEIVTKKNEQIEKLAAFKGMDVENFKEAMDLIKEIDSMQELNLLLTKQALSYQNAVLESISQNINNFSNTYSAKGTYQNTDSINIVDQSV
ncbi:MAG: flagellar protein FlgN [Tissierella sp.]|nr:flagellar protein FlgN [Tissierella sp.]